MKWTWTGKPFVYTDWRTGDEKNLCLDGAQESHTATARCTVEHIFWHPNALRWCRSLLRHLIRTLRLIFISKSKIDSERTPFWVNRKHPEVCNAGLKLHPTKCVPGLLQWMAAALEKVCAGTRDVLWRWPRFSWINKNKTLFWNQSHYFTVGPRTNSVTFRTTEIQLLSEYNLPLLQGHFFSNHI